MTTIRLDKDRKLQYDTDAFLDFEEISGRSLFDLVADFNVKTQPKLKEMIIFLWAGLKQHEGLSYEEVKKLFPLTKIMDTMLQCILALNEGMGLPTPIPGLEKKNTKPSKNGLKMQRDIAMHRG